MPRSSRSSRFALPLLALAGLASLAGCRGEAPYPPSARPGDDVFMAATAPTLDAVQVPRAKIRQGGGPGANLMLVAQAPERFAGTIQVAGNELVSLAVNEDEYGLRWVGGREGASLPPGYYSGPPTACAVESLLGLRLDPEAFVGMILGGAPLIDGPHEVLDRRWDRKARRELITITNGSFEQQLRFAWFEEQWVFAGATSWRIEGGGKDDGKLWLWTIRHDELHVVAGKIVPKKTVIKQPKPNGRGSQSLTVSFQKQVPNPPALARGAEVDPDSLGEDPPKELIDGDSGDDGDDGNHGDSWDGDDWGDDDDDWENADGSASSPSPSSPTTPASAPAEEAKPAEPDPIPPQFLGNPTGLQARGDLCGPR